MLRSLTFAIAAACAFAAFAAPASAHTRMDDTRAQVRVSYADLDLSKTQDADELLRRVNYAAQRVCRVPRGPMPLSLRAAYRECVEGANDRAVARINDPLVLARYIERTGRNPRPTLLAANEAN